MSKLWTFEQIQCNVLFSMYGKAVVLTEQDEKDNRTLSSSLGTKRERILGASGKTEEESDGDQITTKDQ